MDDLSKYPCRAARALVLLHEARMREFVGVWRAAKAAGVTLHAPGDPAYESLEHLLQHVLGAARHYMVWMAKQLELPRPAMDPAPDVEEIEARLDAYVEHLLLRWREPLAVMDPSRLEDREYKSAWGQSFTIDGMLEHAVMHPVRHAFQLTELMA